LLQKRSFTLHRPARKSYPMKMVIVSGVNIQLQADLVDMQQWATQNDGFRYILLAIDCFSRYAYSRPLKTKQGIVVRNAIEEILEEAESHIDRKIKYLQTDEGKEFYNSHVKEILDKKHIKLFSTKSPTKAQMVERLIRTLRARQERYNTFKGVRRWLESFPKLVKSYNSSAHTSLPKGTVPANVNLQNEKSVWLYMYKDIFFKPTKSQNKLKVGDSVRLSKRKKQFEKAFYQNWTDEIFFIVSVSDRSKPTTYRIADSQGEVLEGVFYRQELAPIRFEESTDRRVKGKIYAIERVIEEEIRNDGKKYLLVKWRGYPDSDNQWIRADQFTSIQRAI